MLAGIEPTRLFELRSIVVSLTQSPISSGIVPVMLASDITSLRRERKAEKLDSNGSSSWTDCIVISVTRPWGEHVMEVQLHGVASSMFQCEKDGGGGEAEL